MITDNIIKIGKAMIGQVQYSMAYPARLGPRFRDCSSFVLACAISAGGIPEVYKEGNTETLYALNGTYLEEIYDYNQVKQGDIFILGQQGKSGGANGHTGYFIDKDTILHCSYSKNGVAIDKATNVIDGRRSKRERYFRLKSAKNEGIRFIKNETHTVTLTSYISSHTKPDLTSPYYKHLKPGDRFTYTKVYEANGFRWLYFKNRWGKEMYLPYRHTSNPYTFVKF